MKVFLEYFGLLVFAFVLLVGGLILYPKMSGVPATSAPEMVGLALGFFVIAGGFTWYYLAASHQGSANAQ